MDNILLSLYLVMALFLLLLGIFLVRFIVKWNRIKDEEKNAHLERISSASNGKGLVKIPTPRFRLDRGRSYFMMDDQSKEGFRLLKAYLARDLKGICITHFKPDGVEKRFDLTNTEFIWLTREKAHDNGCTVIPPTSLGFVLQELGERGLGDKSIIYMDTLERVYKENGPERTNKFLMSLKQHVQETDAILLMSAEPAGINKKVREFLKADFKELAARKRA